MVCERITNNLVKLRKLGMLPSECHGEYIVWRPRKYNVRADYCCNISMDTGREVDFKTTIPSDANSCKVNTLAFTDGGCRYEGESVNGLVIYSVLYQGEQAEYITRAMKSTLTQ